MGCSPSLTNVAIYRKFKLISAAQSRKNEKATVTGYHGPWHPPWSGRGLCWNRFLILFLLHGCSNSWMTMGEVKPQPVKGKC